MADSDYSIFDGHNDVLLAELLDPEGRCFLKESANGHLDLERGKRGGMSGGIFAAFVPNQIRTSNSDWGIKKTEQGYEMPSEDSIQSSIAEVQSRKMFDLAHSWEESNPERIQIVRTAKDLTGTNAEEKFSIVLHLEGAEAIRPDCSNLESWFKEGLRSLGLVWSRENDFGHGVPIRFPGSGDTGPGLKKAARLLVKECERFGILLDVSHLNEQGFYDLTKLVSRPFCASHSGAYSLCNSPRNLTDDQIRLIANSGGIIGIPFAVFYLCEKGSMCKSTPIKKVAEHAAYIANLVGEDYVGLGSDFDGALIPEEIRDASGLPLLVSELKNIGFSEKSLEKVLSGNWLRLLQKSLPN